LKMAIHHMRCCVKKEDLSFPRLLVVRHNKLERY
jgi:hypothetical protein